MNFFLSILAFTALPFGIFFLYRLVKFRQAVRRVSARAQARMQPLHAAFAGGKVPTPAEVYPYAQDLLTREATFHLLHAKGHPELFPAQFYTLEAGAAASLAHWLEFPTELGRCPDEIEAIHQEPVEMEGHTLHYQVFRYRVDPPIPKGAEGWMLGVVGPYHAQSRPYDVPRATFSRLTSKWGEADPAAEAQWVHARIAMR